MFRSYRFISKTNSSKPFYAEIFNLNVYNISRVSFLMYPSIFGYLFWILTFYQILTCKFATVNKITRNKICTAEEAVKDIPDGSKLLVGGKKF